MALVAGSLTLALLGGVVGLDELRFNYQAQDGSYEGGRRG